MGSALLAGTSMYWAVKAGKLKPNSRFGPWPKVAGFGSLAYVVAKLSYVLGENCINKFIDQAPNSDISQHLRENRGHSDQMDTASSGNYALMDIVDSDDFDEGQLSGKERQILMDCNSTAFYQYSLPLSSVLGLTIFSGVLRSSRFKSKSLLVKSLPVVLGSTVGYFLGQLVYIYSGDCTSRFLQFAPEGVIATRLSEQFQHTGSQHGSDSMCETCQAAAVIEGDHDEYVIPRPEDIALRDIKIGDKRSK